MKIIELKSTIIKLKNNNKLPKKKKTTAVWTQQ